MSTLKIEHISHLDNGTPDLSIDSSGHLNIVNGNLQMGGVTMLDASDTTLKNVSKLGIGTATPGYKLHLHESSSSESYQLFTNSTTGATTSDGFRIGIDSNENALIWHREANSIQFATSNDTKMVILANGNVGIGEVSPAGKLEVQNTSVNYAILGTSNKGHYFESQSDDNTDGFEIYQQHGSTASRHSFIVNDNRTGSKSAAFAVRGDGNVGIGTTSPQRMLHIHDGSQTGLHITNTQSGAGANDGFSQYIRDDNQATELMVRENSYLGFGTNNQLKVKITNGGILEGLSDAEILTSPIRKHSNTISTNTTIATTENAVASGPLAIADGVTLTINGNMTVV